MDSNGQADCNVAGDELDLGEVEVSTVRWHEHGATLMMTVSIQACKYR